jgi:hypothetical protein
MRRCTCGTRRTFRRKRWPRNSRQLRGASWPDWGTCSFCGCPPPGAHRSTRRHPAEVRLLMYRNINKTPGARAPEFASPWLRRSQARWRASARAARRAGCLSPWARDLSRYSGKLVQSHGIPTFMVPMRSFRRTPRRCNRAGARRARFGRPGHLYHLRPSRRRGLACF